MNLEARAGFTTRATKSELANAIMKVARSTNNARGATLYLTHSPCKECSKLVLQSGIKRLVYLDAYKDPAGLHLLEQGGVLIHQLTER